MADLAKTIAIIFEGDDQITRTMNKITGSLDSFAGGVEDMTQPFADLAGSLLKVEAAAVAMVAGGIGLAISKAGEFGDSFSEISTLVTASDEDLNQFKDDILDYSRDSTQSIDKINSAVYSAISAGVEYGEALDFLSSAEKLSVAGKAELESTTKVLISTLNSYGESTDQASKYSDVLFQTVKLGQTTLPELATSLSKVTGIAAAGGVPIETLGAAIASLTASGLPTAEAMTSLKAALSNIIKPASEAQKIAAQLGIEFNASALESKGFEGVLRDVYTATGGNVEQMAKLFGSTEALNAVLVLAEDKTGKFKNALEEMQKATGSTTEAYDKMADNFALANQKLINNLKATLIDVGTPLLENYGTITEAISEIFKSFGVAFEAGAFDEIYEGLSSFAGDITQLFLDIAKNLPEALEAVDFKGLVKSFGDLSEAIGGAFEAFFGDIDLSTPEGLRKVVQKIVDSFTALTNTVTGIVEGLTPFIKKAGELVTKLTSADGETHKLVGNFLGLATGVNKVAGLVGEFTGALNVLAGAMATRAAVDVVGLVKGVNGLGTALTAAGGVVGKLAGQAGLLGLAAAAGVAAGSLIRMIPHVDEGQRAFAAWTDKIFNWTGNQPKVDKSVTDLQYNIAALSLSLRQGSTEFSDATIEADEFNEMLKKVQDTPTDITISAEADKESFEIANKVVGEYIDEDGKTIKVYASTDSKNLEETKKAIDESVPELKRLEIEANLHAEEIKAQAETIQTAIEWKAQLDIAEVEANARKVEAIMGSISETMQSSADIISSAFGALGNVSSINFYDIMHVIEEEMDLRREALEMQKDMTRAQIEYMNAKKEQISKGAALIQVEAVGLTPALEMIWQEVLEHSQVRTTEEGLGLLL